MVPSEMMNYLVWFRQWFAEHETIVWWLGVLSIMTFFVTLIALALVIIFIPAHYFSEDPGDAPKLPIRNPVTKFSYLIIKNILGVVFILAGLLMLLTPGQGLLSILIGVSLASFPGKRRLIRRIIGSERVLRPANRLRAKFDRPELESPVKPGKEKEG